MNKLLILCIGLLVSLNVGAYTLAALEADAPIVMDKTGLAMDGYDMVAYFEGKKEKGNPQYSSEHRGATWHFASQANKAKFDADSEKYMPEFGGYCVYAISKKLITKGAGKYGDLIDGKLFFSADFITQKRYHFDTKYYNAKAAENWPEVKQRILEGKK